MKKDDATRVVVDYVVLGDGQFTVQVVDKKDRDHLRKKRVKEKMAKLKESVSQEHGEKPDKADTSNKPNKKH